MRHTTEFETWYLGAARGLRAFAFMVAQNRHEADEALQDAMSRCWRRWDDMPAAEFETYCRRAIVNSVISTARRNARTTPVADLAPVEDHLTDEVTTADTDAAWALCAELPPQQRAALVLRFYYDQGYPQIADTLSCSQATVRSHIRHALTRLRAQLAEENCHDHA